MSELHWNCPEHPHDDIRTRCVEKTYANGLKTVLELSSECNTCGLRLANKWEESVEYLATKSGVSDE